MKAYNKFFGCEIPIVSIYSDNKVIYDYEFVKVFAKYLKKRVKNGAHQNGVGYTGRTGSGKSTCALDVIYEMDPDFDLDTNYIYTTTDFTHMLKKKKRNNVVLIDEGSIVLNSMNSQRKNDVLLTVAFDNLRSFGGSYHICIPNLNDLNNRIRANHIDFLVKCPVKSPIPGVSPKGFADLYVHQYRDWGKDYYKKVGTFIFPKLPKKIDDVYQRIKLEHQERFIESMPEDE